MPEFRVIWEIDFDTDDADTPEEAARKALEIQRDNASLATVFSVVNRQTGVLYEVDLSKKTGKQIVRVEK